LSLAAAPVAVSAPARLTAQGTPQGSSDTLHLSLDVLLDSVQTSHPIVKQGSAATFAAHARAAALGRPLENPVIEVQHSSKASYQVYGLQPIPWPWEIAARRHLGQAEVSVAHASEAASTDSVALDAAQRFVNALRAHRELALASEAESLARVALDRAVSARQLGQGGDLTLLQARVTLDAARRDHVTARDRDRVAVQSLVLLLGQPPDAPVVLEGDLATVAPVTEPDSGYAAEASSTDPELKRFTALDVRARREASLWRSQGRFPHLAVGPSYGWLIVVKPRVDYLGINFTLDLPLFHGREDEIEAANYERAAAQAGRNARLRELDVLVLEATTTLGRAGRQLDSLRAGDLVRAAQAESLATAALRQGGPYLTTWLAARQAYLDVRRAQLDLEWQAAQARLTLRYLTGTLLEPPDQGNK